MADLTPEERQRIYQEEKARQDAQDRLQKERIQKNNKGCYGCLGIFTAVALVILLLSLFAGNGDKQTNGSSLQLTAIFEKTTTQVKICNLDSFTWSNIILRLNPDTFGDAYEYHLPSLKPGETAKIGLLNFTKNNGVRFDPFHLAVKELHVIAKTEKGEGATGFRWIN